MDKGVARSEVDCESEESDPEDWTLDKEPLSADLFQVLGIFFFYFNYWFLYSYIFQKQQNQVSSIICTTWIKLKLSTVLITTLFSY